MKVQCLSIFCSYTFVRASPTQRISSVFPMLQGHARALLGKLQNIRDTTDREDLKVSATTFAGQLERRIPSLTPGGVIAGEPAAAEPEEAAPKKGKGKGDGEAVAKKVKEAGTPKDAGVDVSEEKPAKASKGDKAAKSEAAPAPVKVTVHPVSLCGFLCLR